MYDITTIRRKAYAIGLQVKKGSLRCLGSACHDVCGNRIPGYMVVDLSTGLGVWPSCNETYSFCWQLYEVVNFLKDEYQTLGLEW